MADSKGSQEQKATVTLQSHWRGKKARESYKDLKTAGKVEGKGEEKKGEEKKVDEEFKKWRESLKGKVYLPGDSGYDEARETWNAAFVKSPAIIIEPEVASDLTRGLKYAHEHKLHVRVKSGGHSMSGKCTADGVLLFNLKKLNWVNVNVEEQTAWIGGGCLLEEVDRETHAYGLWTTMGTYPKTGVGLALHGGFGYLSPKYGLTVDNILELDVVTPDGKLLRANATQNTDLFWGLRGAATHLGIVTQLKVQLYPSTEKCYGGMLVWEGEHVAKLTSHYYSNLRKWPLEFFAMWISPPAAAFGGKQVVIGTLGYSGPGAEEKGKEIVDTFRAIATPMVDHCQVTSYINGIQRITEPMFGPKMSYHITSRFLQGRDMDSDFLKDVAERMKTKPDNVMLALEDFHGISQDKKADYNALSTRHHTFGVLMAVPFAPKPTLEAKEQEARDQSVQWTRDTWKELGKYINTSAFYYNYVSTDEQTHSQKNWGENFEKLIGLKQKYDPTGILLPLA